MLSFIPPYMGDNPKQKAERKVFDILHNLCLKNAHIIHSLGLPRHICKIYGEIDFVVICELGVACLEVKGGRVSCEDGIWKFIDGADMVYEKREGPFEQVKNGMFSLRERIWEQLKNYPKFRDMTFACGVMFPDISFKYSGVSIIPEVIFDQRHDPSAITEYFRNIFQFWKDRKHHAKSNEQVLLSASEINTLRNFLRGDFSFVPPLAEQMDTTNERLLRLTEEQYNVLEALSENDRLIIRGAAGTGKTLLAVEYAKRQALCGNRVLVLTYNKNLAKFLKSHQNDMLDISHFHGLVSKYISTNEISDNFYNTILPEKFYDVLSSGRIVKYDVLVVDEAQDLLKPAFVCCLDELVKGGLSSGKWCIFYDNAQNIFNDELENGMSLLEGNGAVKFTLQINCRNTKPIGLTNALLTHFPPAKTIREDGENVDFILYEDDKDFSDKLIALIKKYKLHSVNLNDITILSPVTYNESSISKMEMLTKACDVNIVGKSNDAGINYSTIQGFKGLESKIVILLDLDRIIESQFDSLLYVAISRAKVQLHVFCSKEMKKILDDKRIEGARRLAKGKV